MYGTGGLVEGIHERKDRVVGRRQGINIQGYKVIPTPQRETGNEKQPKHNRVETRLEVVK